MSPEILTILDMLRAVDQLKRNYWIPYINMFDLLNHGLGYDFNTVEFAVRDLFLTLLIFL